MKHGIVFLKKFLDLIRWFFHATLDPYEEGIPYCADIKCKKVFGIEFSEKMSVYVFIPGSLGMSCGKGSKEMTQKMRQWST